MRRTSGLVLVAVGAILALAVSIRLPFLNLRVTGVILMLTGMLGMHPPKRMPGRLRRWAEFIAPLLDLPDDPAERLRVPLYNLLRPRSEPATSEPATSEPATSQPATSDKQPVA
jgi:hypothetical protein